MTYRAKQISKKTNIELRPKFVRVHRATFQVGWRRSCAEVCEGEFSVSFDGKGFCWCAVECLYHQRKHLLSTLCVPFVSCSINGSLVHDGRLRLARPRSRGSKLKQLASDFRGHRRSCHVESPVVLYSGTVSCIMRFVLVVLLLRESHTQPAIILAT